MCYFYGYTHGIWKMPGQRLNPSCSCNLCHSCSTGPLHWPGNQTCTFTATQAGVVGFLTYCATMETSLDTSINVTFSGFVILLWLKKKISSFIGKKHESINKYQFNFKYFWKCIYRYAYSYTYRTNEEITNICELKCSWKYIYYSWSFSIKLEIISM